MTSRLVTIDCDYLAPELAAAYLRIEGDEAAFVEANTARAVPKLLAALARAGLAPEQVRWVIITHVHLDHAAGASALLAACPNARLVAHPRAARHAKAPGKLVASAKAVYGEARFEAIYGAIEPIDAARVDEVEDAATRDLGGATLTFLHTRGHANHHLVVHGRREHRQPVGGVDVAVLLERVAGAGGGPRHQHRVRERALDGQQRSAGRLHGDEAPEAAHHGILPATQRAAGIRLADGAADGIHAAGAGAAAAGDLGPVHRVALP